MMPIYRIFGVYSGRVQMGRSFIEYTVTHNPNGQVILSVTFFGREDSLRLPNSLEKKHIAPLPDQGYDNL
jgi:hypothetical protein